jgi:uncharacterized protein (DUF433 family)
MVAKELEHRQDADELIARYIELDPDHPSEAEARIAKYGVPVWALVGYAPAARGNLSEVARVYDLPLDAVYAAILYYHRHKAVIDDRRAANTPAVT